MPAESEDGDPGAVGGDRAGRRVEVEGVQSTGEQDGERGFLVATAAGQFLQVEREAEQDRASCRGVPQGVGEGPAETGARVPFGHGGPPSLGDDRAVGEEVQGGQHIVVPGGVSVVSGAHASPSPWWMRCG
ncbi:hypothetical protein GCM10018980_33190 [Streptomyces capoamus]|uniref:Uncharacterized protein n=1 Tax=Streptomyces capoamus TaxID=68183 RepID=A0A919EX86_9ACTN|nr:hypothetical protein GCM10018980_33190 [Streptomyces capoamus]